MSTIIWVSYTRSVDINNYDNSKEFYIVETTRYSDWDFSTKRIKLNESDMDNALRSITISVCKNIV